MARTPPAIEIVGLRAFMRELALLSPEVDAKFKAVNYEVAEKVKGEAMTDAQALGGVAAKAAPSLRATKTKNYSSIRLGGAKAPYAQGAEFGSDKFRQFKPWRGNQWSDRGPGGVGYFLQPKIRDMDKEIQKMYADAFDKIAAGTFPDR